mmetsp:Transcript_32234/g.49851  ORF Transcript_32234/g.49851 Transcript_32234/m.49851 type:complete len:98 (+) Transcript_32234:236-529(+)
MYCSGCSPASVVVRYNLLFSLRAKERMASALASTSETAPSTMQTRCSVAPVPASLFRRRHPLESVRVFSGFVAADTQPKTIRHLKRVHVDILPFRGK